MKTSIQVFVGIALMLCCLVAFVPAAAAAETPQTPTKSLPKRPNIVLIVVDDLGYGDVGCFEGSDVATPNLDRMAREGVRFHRFRVNPLCAPTRAALLSGIYSQDTGLERAPRESAKNERTLVREVRLLPQLLKEQGYTTGLFGKWHLGSAAPNLPRQRGFDEFFGFLEGSHPYFLKKHHRLFDNDKSFNGSEGHTTDLFTEHALRFIRSNQTRPFFCLIAYNAVHGPLWRPDDPKPSAKEEWLKFYSQRNVPFPRRDYNAVISHMDAGCGRILSLLRELKLDDKTMLIWMSDNGAQCDKYPGSNGKLRGEKGMVYEGGIRVPAAVRWPGYVPSGDSNDNVMHFDLFSTIVDVAGKPILERNGPGEVRGISLLAHLRSGGKTPLPDRYLFWEHSGRMAVVYKHWKLVGEISNPHGKYQKYLPQVEQCQFALYNLDTDPAEKTDIARRHPEVYADLKKQYVNWWRSLK